MTAGPFFCTNFTSEIESVIAHEVVIASAEVRLPADQMFLWVSAVATSNQKEPSQWVRLETALRHGVLNPRSECAYGSRGLSDAWETVAKRSRKRMAFDVSCLKVALRGLVDRSKSVAVDFL